ncbi:MAG: hypothetical protein GAK30_00283 [Paracidovorax wautersii]|uniref:Uncharacterized protein n=1 Tax=Paracidovorax wautersii TaxID=1177982 RepID=A0A7V8JSA3_9BURK|nr:MAG: hypothetical protein GAK30_00283 [Paracidovorax wautersii]
MVSPYSATQLAQARKLGTSTLHETPRRSTLALMALTAWREQP